MWETATFLEALHNNTSSLFGFTCINYHEVKEVSSYSVAVVCQ